ncbi:MAG: DUF2914 domain-containing protein [bacterium]
MFSSSSDDCDLPCNHNPTLDLELIVCYLLLTFQYPDNKFSLKVMYNFFKNIIGFYEHYKRFTPIAFFFGGFTWDSLTLTRIDRMTDNLILLGYIVLLGILIILVSLVDKGIMQKPILVKYQEWYPNGLQFFLGGLFSSYVVFYFQSASLTKTSLFLGILVLLLIANEFLEKRLTNLNLLIVLYFLATFSFFIFFIPVLIKVMNVFTFITGGLLSLIFVTVILIFLYKKSIISTRKKLFFSGTLVAFLFILLNLFYAQNWMPPVPLSLKSGGMYHHVSKRKDFYTLKFEQPKWYQFWKKSDRPFRYAEGDTVFCFTAIFAPTKLTKRTYHHWQQYFPTRKAWITTDRLGYPITGGRGAGYRGYTYKKNVSPGKWRVDVETEEGLILGRINFKITEVESKVALKTIYK